MVKTTNNESRKSDRWFLDNGCSNHMTANKNWLKEINTRRNSKVKLAYHRTLVGKGMGKIVIERKNGKLIVI